MNNGIAIAVGLLVLWYLWEDEKARMVVVPETSIAVELNPGRIGIDYQHSDGIAGTYEATASVGF